MVYFLQQRLQRGVATTNEDHGLLLRPGLELEGRLGDDPQRAERADVQFAEVIAGDILDDPAARFDLLPLVVDDADAKEVIAQGTESIAAGAPDVCRPQPAPPRR